MMQTHVENSNQRKALVVGAGSAGTRHAAILTDLGMDVTTFSRRSRQGGAESLEQQIVADQPDYIVIATETAAHEPNVQSVISSRYRKKLLVEKPFQVHRDTIVALTTRDVVVGFNLRFSPILRELRKHVHNTTIYSVEIYCGQTLNAWRPKRTLHSQYSSHAALGGGALADLSHEIDYAVWLFGRAKRVTALGGRYSQLTVDSDDSWGILMESERVPIMTIQLNYFDTCPQRRLTVNTSEGTLIANLVQETLETPKGTFRFPGASIITYADMHKSVLQGDMSQACTLEEALTVDSIIDAVRLSSTNSEWVSLS